MTGAASLPAADVALLLLREHRHRRRCMLAAVAVSVAQDAQALLHSVPLNLLHPNLLGLPCWGGLLGIVPQQHIGWGGGSGWQECVWDKTGSRDETHKCAADRGCDMRESGECEGK